MFKRTGIYLLGIASIFGCATFPPPDEKQPMADQELLAQDDPETTAEWLFVMSELGRAGAKNGCSAVASWVKGEANCTGEICIHARDLGKEWVNRCGKEAPGDLGVMQDLVNEFDTRADQQPDACVREGTMLLRTVECGAPDACEKQAQKWMSRCGDDYATPLFVLMLTRTMQRRVPDDRDEPEHIVKFDTRSCDALAKEAVTGVGCDGNACEKPVSAAVAWMDRCYARDTKVPLRTALALADVLVGGGKAVEPMQVDSAKVAENVTGFPLMFADRAGVVSWICGERPNNLEQYVRARQGCARGEAVIARVGEKNILRTVTVPHSDDATFSSWFPFLEVIGEQEARAQSGLAAFKREIANAVEKAQGDRPEEAIPLLIQALQKDPSVFRWDVYRKALGDVDGNLVPALKAWGKLKAKGLKTARGVDEQQLYARRSFLNPLHDTQSDGTIRAGSNTAVPWIALDRWIPSALGAYRHELSSLQRLADRVRVSDVRNSQVLSEIEACVQGQKRVKAANGEVLACISRDDCKADKIALLASAVASDREAVRRAREGVVRSLGSGMYSVEGVDGVGRLLLEGGCGE